MSYNLLGVTLSCGSLSALRGVLRLVSIGLVVAALSGFSYSVQPPPC